MSTGYVSTIQNFSSTTALEKIGTLATAVANSGISSQRRELLDAWNETIGIVSNFAQTLKSQVAESSDWSILLEYEIPRRALRPDVVILARDLIFILEFKVGAKNFVSADRWQARDYALNLRDYHQESKHRSELPHEWWARLGD